ncbi:MAG: translation initiation factor IF-2 subunit gamma [Candidatus Micrarchaeota archaeon]
MMQAEMNIGMLGHVDHGKTTLTKALTGKWTDTHSEEIKRGISIRLGYADAYIYECPKCQMLVTGAKCPQCGGKTKLLRKISIVDAPGHETLMTTVISATSILDGVMFLIAANEPCPQPQTAEHLLVLNSTGIKNIIVVQTKIDLVPREKAIENYKQIKAFLKGSAAENAPIVPISANAGLNIDALLRTINSVMAAPKHEGKELRMYVSRSFDVNRPGTAIKDLKGGVLGGSIVQGVLSVGDEIEIKPGITKKEGAKPAAVVCTVKSLMEESEALDSAGAGGLVAIGTSLDPSLSKSDSLVGSVVGHKGQVPEPVDAISVKYSVLERADMQNMPLREGEPVVVNVHTSTGVGVVAKLGKGVASIKLKKPTVVYKDMHVALSRRVGQRWRLAAWGRIV